jgi:uncharacterized protein YkwD
LGCNLLFNFVNMTAGRGCRAILRGFSAHLPMPPAAARNTAAALLPGLRQDEGVGTLQSRYRIRMSTVVAMMAFAAASGLAMTGRAHGQYYRPPVRYGAPQQPYMVQRPATYAAQPAGYRTAAPANAAAQPANNAAAQPAPAVQPAGDYGFTAWLNGVRARYGLRPVGYDANLANWAAANNAQQSRRGLGHFVMGPARRQNAAIGNAMSVGATWMASPAHRAALLDPTITRIGLAGLGSYWTFNAY